MVFSTIKELSTKFAMPERTVYYNLAKNPAIRTKKEGRTKLIHIEDFAKACNKTPQWLHGELQKEMPIGSKSKLEKDIASLQQSLQDLQHEQTAKKEKILALQQSNTDLKADRESFIQRYEHEKDEKEKLRWQYAIVQQNHHEEIKRYLKKYYITLGICVVSVLLLLGLTITPLLWSLGILNS